MLQDPSDKSSEALHTAGLRRILILIPSIADYHISNQVLRHMFNRSASGSKWICPRLHKLRYMVTKK